MLAGVLAMASMASMAVAYSIIWTSKLVENWRNGQNSGGNEALHIFGALPPMGVAGVHVLDGFT